MQLTDEIGTFLDKLASGDPTPGGGSASALAGAMGAALVAMVARLTIGRQRYADVDAQMRSIADKAEALRLVLTSLVAADAMAYDRVREAYRMPKQSEVERARRDDAIQEALREATRTPLDTGQACLQVLRLSHPIVASGNINAVSDAAVGALLAHAGLQGAARNVQINLKDIIDTGFVAAGRASVEQALAEAAMLSHHISETTSTRLQAS